MPLQVQEFPEVRGAQLPPERTQTAADRVHLALPAARGSRIRASQNHKIIVTRLPSGHTL